jgi:hypothetical protein
MAAPTLTVDPKEVDAALDAEFKALSKRVRGAMERVGRDALLTPVRDATRAALKSSKLPTTWRGQLQPKDDKPTLAPAFFVWSKAPKIIGAFSEGATIAPTGGRRYLWIPTENVPKGRGGRPYKPAEVERKFKKFIFARSKSGSLVALVMARTGYKETQHRRGAAPKMVFKRATKKEPGEKIAMFILVRQVRLRKRLDPKGIAETAGARYALAYHQAANSS